MTIKQTKAKELLDVAVDSRPGVPSLVGRLMVYCIDHYYCMVVAKPRRYQSTSIGRISIAQGQAARRQARNHSHPTAIGSEYTMT